MLLKVENLETAYGHARVLHNVSMHVKKGEMIFMVGRNGAGKTSMLLTVAGFLKPQAGRIIYEDAEISGEKPENIALKGVRYVFQDKRVFSKLTVRENIEIAAHPFKEETKEAIDKVAGIYPAITRFLDKKAGGLSGGQRQLLLLGRSLIGRPKLLLIDEPTEGLAAGIIEEVFKVLKRLKGEISMLIVEQNLDIVVRLADRVYAMKEGTIPSEMKTPKQIGNRARMEKFL